MNFALFYKIYIGLYAAAARRMRYSDSRQPKCFMVSPHLLLYWNYGKKSLESTPSTSFSSCYAHPSSIRVLPDIPLQLSSHSVYTNVGSDNLRQ
jgi:hypothetical protein